MKPNDPKESRPTEPTAPEESPNTPPEEPSKPYSRRARALAWLGIAFMVFLTIMYYYVFASGQVINW